MKYFKNVWGNLISRTELSIIFIPFILQPASPLWFLSQLVAFMPSWCLNLASGSHLELPPLLTLWVAQSYQCYLLNSFPFLEFTSFIKLPEVSCLISCHFSVSPRRLVFHNLPQGLLFFFALRLILTLDCSSKTVVLISGHTLNHLPCFRKN